MSQGTIYRGWQGDEKDRKRTTSQHFDDARRNYAAVYADPADICLCSHRDAQELGPCIDGILVQGRAYMPRLRFYVGRMPS